MTAIVGASIFSHSVVAQIRGSNPYSLKNFAQPDFEENVVSAADISTQTEQQMEMNEQQSSEQQKETERQLYQSYRKTLIRSILIEQSCDS
jgi:hypothetical protein